MVAQVTLNPGLTTNAAGSFSVTSSGLMQGTAMADPATRNALAGGVLAATETVPMWGGVGIAETVWGATGGPRYELGGSITRATTLAAAANGQLTGFSVFDQNYHNINTPQSPVPLTPTGMGVNFYRLGSGARIAVNAVTGLAVQAGQNIQQPLSWDFTAQQLIPYSPTYAADTITGAVWAATNGGQVTFTVSTDITSNVNAGDVIEVSGVVNTGGTSTSAFNGQFVVLSATSTTVVVSYPAAASPGTYASGGSILAGGGILPVKLLDVQVGNSMTVVFDPVTGFATWNRSGTAALILI